ncbi:MAG TPA: hypothetical protein VLI93_04895 [Acetobacteraceae bacterium]|nr:hypothetical protein [Acetobacteraceae bacterium]
MDGPPARMTAAAMQADRANDVALLYYFAVEAGQIPAPPDPRIPTAPPFPAQDLQDQQRALSGVGNWKAVTLVGEGYIDKQCYNFLAALDDLERSKKTTLADLSALQGATVGIMGLALAAQKTIGIVGVAFGLAASLFDTTTSAVLYQLPASAVASIVVAQSQYLRASEDTMQIPNQGQASARLSEYLRYCVPVTIEANISKVLNNSRGSASGIVTQTTRPAVVSAVVHEAAFRASLPTRTELKRQIDTLNPDQLKALAVRMQPNLAEASSKIRSTVRALDPGNARFSNPSVARQVLDIWVVTEDDPTALTTWADAIDQVTHS